MLIFFFPLGKIEMKVHMHTKFCLICLLTFIFHHCNHCHEEHDHGSEEHHRHHRGMTESESSEFSVLDAENEKKYYIEKLFDRYGENGRLSFFGLEKLLTNLGLGEIKVVEINHEDLGHDHVSHLDILAVQEGKHFHSHNHQHSHNHLNSENQTVTSVSAKRNRKCDPEKETIEVSVKSDDKHMHDHNHRLCHHHCLRHHLDHNTTRHFPNDSITHGEHGEPSHEPSTETNKTQEQSESKLPKGKRKRKEKKSNENSGVIAPGFPSNHDQGEQYEHNRVHKPDRVHNPGHSHVRLPEHNGHDPGHGHQDLDPDIEGELRHTRKREAPHVKKSAIYSAASHKDHNEDDRQHEVSRIR